MDPPPAETLIRALEMLYALGALNDRGELTGAADGQFPMDPQLSKMLIMAERCDRADEVLSVRNAADWCADLHRPGAPRRQRADQLQQAGRRRTALLGVWSRWAETQFSTQWCFENFVESARCAALFIREQIEGERVEIELEVEQRQRQHLQGDHRQLLLHGEREGWTTGRSSAWLMHIHPSSAPQGPAAVGGLPQTRLHDEGVHAAGRRDQARLVEIAPHYYRRRTAKTTVEEDTKGQEGGRVTVRTYVGTGWAGLSLLLDLVLPQVHHLDQHRLAALEAHRERPCAVERRSCRPGR